jgi:Uma2 family endonuclease
VVSRSSKVRDYETKRREYLVFGIAEYWIVDPVLRQVTVLTRSGEEWNEAVVKDQQKIPTLVLPGLPFPLADLWVGLPAEDSPEDDLPGA